MATMTLSNGVTLQGTPEQLTTMLKQLGITLPANKYYNSDSQGMILIETMATEHLRRALLKMHREWSSSLSVMSGFDLLRALRANNTNETFVALLTEYAKRVQRGEK